MQEPKKIIISRVETLYLINDFLKTNYRSLTFVPRKSLYKIIVFFLLARKDKEPKYKSPKNIWAKLKKTIPSTSKELQDGSRSN